MKVLLVTSHSIAEYDDLRMLTDLGYDVFSIGAYTDPAHPSDVDAPSGFGGKRPALPDVPYYPDLAALCDQVRAERGEPGPYIDWAKAALHPELIEWADTIIVHHFPERWIGGQWPAIRHKRVIWRTCGQSNPQLERFMSRFRSESLEIVRYSPAERRAYEPLGAFAGEDALIRFGKYLDDWTGWTGGASWVGNVTQNMAGRGDACGLSFWLAATEGLDAKPAGPNSEALPGGVGALSYDEMREYLRRCRAYLYTGTQPASYTLGLMEALLTGTPVLSIGRSNMWMPALFEGDDLAILSADKPADANRLLRLLLSSDEYANLVSEAGRKLAAALFDINVVGPQWAEFLGGLSAREVEQRTRPVAA